MMEYKQRKELADLYVQMETSLNKLPAKRQTERKKIMADIKQLLIADNALRAGDQKLFNYIMNTGENNVQL